MINITELDAGCLPNLSDVTIPMRNALQKALDNNIKVHIPAGRYPVSGHLIDVNDHTKSIAIEGDGIGRTRIIRMNGGESVPFIRAKGTEKYEPQFAHINWFTFRELDFWDALDEPVDFMDLRFAGHFYFNWCFFGGFRRNLLTAYSLWDTTFDQCHFVNGRNEGFHTVGLYGDSTPGVRTRCNNVVFNSCRFEEIKGTGIYFGWDTYKCRINSCKFDRVGTALVFDKSAGNQVMGGQAIFSNTNTIIIKDSFGILIDGMTIDPNLVEPHDNNYAIDIINSKSCTIVNNNIGLKNPFSSGTIQIDAKSTPTAIINNNQLVSLTRRK